MGVKVKNITIYTLAQITQKQNQYIVKNEIQVESNMTHIKFIKEYVLPCFDSPETLKNLYEKSKRIITLI